MQETLEEANKNLKNENSDLVNQLSSMKLVVEANAEQLMKVVNRLDSKENEFNQFQDQINPVAVKFREIFDLPKENLLNCLFFYFYLFISVFFFYLLFIIYFYLIIFIYFYLFIYLFIY